MICLSLHTNLNLDNMKQRSFTLSFLFIIALAFLGSNLLSQNYVTTYAGTGSAGFLNGDTSEAQFNQMFGICIDPQGNIYVADAGNHCIRKIGTDGLVTTYAGIPTQPGYLDGPAAEAKFRQPFNLTMDDEGNLYVSDFLNHRIRKISADMQVTTVAGSGFAGYLEGPAMEAKFNYPRGVCLDDTGNIYVGDSWNHRIRKISTDGMVSSWAGGGTTIGVQSVGEYVDASDTAARFYTPCEVSIDEHNNIYVADAYNHRIRKIDPSRMVTTLAGSGGHGPNGGGFNNGPGNEAEFDTPTALQVVLDGSVYVGDGANHVMRKIDTTGFVTTFAGSGQEGFEDGPDSLATFNFPRGNVMDYDLNRLYIIDYNNHAVRILHIVSGVGIPDESYHDAGIKVFPNPSSGEFNISLTKDFANLEIQLIDSMGRIVLSEKYFNNSLVTMNLDDHDRGVYFLNIYSDGQFVANKKLILAD